MIRRFAAVIVALGSACLAGSLSAQGTKQWTQSRYDDMERGTAEGVAIRSDGRLEVAPSSKLVYTTSGNYVWSIVSDLAGNAYLGSGGTTSGSANVTRVAADGTATEIFAGKELAVQALAMATDGALFVATSPDGKVYRVEPAKAGAAAVARVVFDPASTAEKPKYLWALALGKAGDLYIATGAPAAVYKIAAEGGKAAAGGKPRLLFRTSDQHIRCLLLAPDGNLYAGSDGAGVIYRIDPYKAGALPFAVYSASRREITSLASDDKGNVFAAGVGGKGPIPLPNLPVSGTTAVSITFVQPGSANAATTSTVIPEGSEVYRIATDGTPSKLLTLKDDVVYGLIVHDGKLLAATGNRGRIYRIDTEVAGRWTDIAHLDAAQGMAFATAKDSLLIATSNSGRVFRLSDTGATDASFTSAVFDAQIYSRWGRAEVLPASLASGVIGTFDFFVRSGNVENPANGWSDWTAATPNGGSVGVPGARYVQWKAVLRGAATLDSVGLNYLSKNIAPVVDEVVVQPGARVAPVPVNPNTTVQIGFAPAAGAALAVPFQMDANAAPLAAQKDKTAITARWSAHDDNGDDLMFGIYYKGEAEANWRLLKDKISDHFYSFDSSLLPDGIYTIKIVASDAPVHTDAEALTGEKASSVFVVDTTPPVPGALKAEMKGNSIHATFEAQDSTSPITHAEYSVDAGPWQYLEPTGSLSDSLNERYDFLAAIPHATTSVTDAKEHVIAVRVYDRYENVVTAKALVR